MSYEAMRRAYAVPDLSMVEGAVLVALAFHANAEGIARPSNETLAAKARCEERSVRRGLTALEKRGLISPIGKRKGGRATATRWQLNLESPDADHAREANEPAEAPRMNGHRHPLNPDSVSMNRAESGHLNPDSVSVNPDSVSRNPDSHDRNPDSESSESFRMNLESPTGWSESAREQERGKPTHLPVPLARDFFPDPEGQGRAAANGLDLERTCRMFGDYHHGAAERARAEGKPLDRRSPDGWQIAFRRWCDTERNFSGRAGKGELEPGWGAAIDAALAGTPHPKAIGG